MLLTNDGKDLLPIATEWMRSGRDHPGLLLTSDRGMPRTRAGIGHLVAVLESFMSQHPEPQSPHNRIVWPTADE